MQKNMAIELLVMKINWPQKMDQETHVNVKYELFRTHNFFILITEICLLMRPCGPKVFMDRNKNMTIGTLSCNIYII